jgi:hypothetical protein
MILSTPTSKMLTWTVLLSAFLIVLGTTHEAFAQVTSFSGTQQQISKEIAYIPRLIAVIAYVGGTFFGATGLLKLKDWIHEPDKNPIIGVVIRMSVAAMLIVFPHVLVIVNSTLFGSQDNGSTQAVKIKVPMQSLSSFQRVPLN